MDMLFDPYADGPFATASTTAAATKVPAGTGLAGRDPAESAKLNGEHHGNFAGDEETTGSFPARQSSLKD